MSNESGQPNVYVRPFLREGETYPISKDGGSHPVWRADGKEMFYLATGREAHGGRGHCDR